MGCAILAASLSSCVNDWLDVAPSDGTDADAALTSSSDLAAARTGMYKALKGNSSLVDYYGQQFFVYGDVHAGDDYQYNNIGGSNRASFYYDMNYQTASEFNTSTVSWQSPYVVIGRANRIIAAAEGGAGDTEFVAGFFSGDEFFLLWLVLERVVCFLVDAFNDFLTECSPCSE